MPGPIAAALPWAVPAAASLAGGIMGGKQGTSANSPSSRELIPYGGSGGQDMLNFLLTQGQRNFEQRPDLSPNNAQNAFDRLLGAGGGGGGLGGAERILQMALGMGGGGGVGEAQIFGAGAAPNLRNKFAKGTAEQDAVIAGKYLDPSRNTALGQTVGATRDIASQAFRESQRGLDSRFAAGGRFGAGGLTNATQKAGADFSRGLTANIGNMLNTNFQNERGRMTQIMGDLNNATIGLRNNLSSIYQSKVGAAAGKTAASFAANASKFGASKMTAASRFGSLLGYGGTLANAAASRASVANNYRLGVFDRAMGLDQANNASALGTDAALSRLAAQWLPVLQGFGKTEQFGQPVSTSGAAISGGLGGLLGGIGAGGQLGLYNGTGGKGGAGGGSTGGVDLAGLLNNPALFSG